MANENQYYKYPFAENGNYDEVPDQASGGVVDYETGYGPDYEKAVGVEGRKRIDRTSFNGIVKGITKNIKQWQERNFPTWIEDDGSSEPAVPFSYDAGVVVYHNDQSWVSLVGSNQDEPIEISGKWAKSEIPIGIGQTWQDMSSFRSLGVTYTNTTGMSIMVSAVSTSKLDSGLQLVVDGVLVCRNDIGPTGGNLTVTASGIVPADSTYRIEELNGVLYTWSELRV